jgi:hypothetical protein
VEGREGQTIPYSDTDEKGEEKRRSFKENERMRKETSTMKSKC